MTPSIEENTQSGRHAEHMAEAVAEACRGVECGDGGPFGAVIVDREGSVVATGHNMVLVTKDPTMHAEMTAIRNACKALGEWRERVLYQVGIPGKFDLSGLTLYTSCYPCPMCMGASLWARFDAIYYGATAQQVERTCMFSTPSCRFRRLKSDSTTRRSTTSSKTRKPTRSGNWSISLLRTTCFRSKCGRTNPTKPSIER